jgi:hypothetical protein
MIRFALKVLIALLLVGYVMRLDEPAPQSATANGFMPTSYPSAVTPPEDVTGDLSTFTNAQIVVSRSARDVTGFCDREPLACDAGRELIARAAIGIRNIASALMDSAQKNDVRATEPSTNAPVTDEYRPLENYRGAYPILPQTPPTRAASF